MTNETMTVATVDPKAELAEIMEMVAVRKRFYNRALSSLQAVYAIEKKEREALKVAKASVKASKADGGMYLASYEQQVQELEASLAETMAMVFARKKFYNRAMASLQSIYKIEKNHRDAMKLAVAK